MIRLNGQISHKRLTGKAYISKATEVKITLEDKTVIPKAEEQIIEANGFDGLGVVTVVGDANFIPRNILRGKKIWGIVGTGTISPISGGASGIILDIKKGIARSRGFDPAGLFNSSASGTLKQ